MQSILGDYLPLAVFIAISAVISGVLLVAPFIVAYQSPDPEKLSAYECGFNAFDLEVAFLFPWAAAFKRVGVLGFWSMIVFLAVLTVGFVYEWKKGALEWE